MVIMINGIDHLRCDTDAGLPPEGYPINGSNVSEVVEEAHRATQSMRILLCSMRDELRRAGGLGRGDGSRWTSGQLAQRRNITHRLTVAYQSYRRSIRDIENVQFRSGNSTATGNSASVSSGDRSSRRSLDVAVVSSGSSSAMQRVLETDSDTDQVIDLTE